MPLQPILDAIASHCREGEAKHEPWGDYNHAAHRLNDRMSKLNAAIGSTNDADQMHQISRRALQLAGMCCRLVADFKLPVILPHDTLTADPAQSCDDDDEPQQPGNLCGDHDVALAALTSVSLSELTLNMENEGRFRLRTVALDHPDFVEISLALVPALRAVCPRCQHKVTNPLLFATLQQTDLACYAECVSCHYIWRP